MLGRNHFRISLVICLAGFLLSPSWGQVSWIGEVNRDLGTLYGKEARKILFRYKNQSSTDSLQIETVRIDCNCLEATWSEKALAPGNEDLVMLMFYPYREGYYEEKIKVFFQGIRKPFILQISGFVEY